MTGPVGVRGDDLAEVLAIHRQVVQVQEELRVAEARRRVDPVDDLDAGRCADQRVARRLRLVQGLDQQDGPDPVRRAGGEDQVLQGERVLRGGVDVVDPVAVERVERLAADRGGEVCHHLDVGPEAVRLRAGHGERASVGAGQLSGVEVQSHQLGAGVVERLLQRVEFGLRRGGGLGPWPPQLDRREARRGGCRGSLQKREFREEDRKVHIEALVRVAHEGFGAPSVLRKLVSA